MIVIYHLWQWVKHAWLHSDLFQALNGEHLTAPGFQQWEPEFLSQYAWGKNGHNYWISIYISIKINLKMSTGVWSTLPIFQPIHLHGSLQCHAQLTYIHLHWLNILTIIFQKTNVHSNIYWSMQVHLHADLVYLFISITGIVATPYPFIQLLL